MTYPTTANLKTFLGVTTSGEDTQIGWHVDAAIAFVKEYCGHDFVAEAAQTFTVIPEYPNLLMGRRVLLCRHNDIISITSITNGDGVAVSSGNYRLLPESGPPYYMIELDADSGLIWWRGSDGSGVVTIVAASEGYSASCPKDIFQAILQIAAISYRERLTGSGGAIKTATRDAILIEATTLPGNILDVLNLRKRRTG